MKLPIAFLFLSFLIIFQGCKKDLLPPLFASQDYFPIEVGQKFEYLMRGIPTNADSSFAITDTSSLTSSITGEFWVDTVVWKVEKDTIFQNRVYKKLINNYGLYAKLIRKQNAAYYSLDFDAANPNIHTLNEELFLKENVNAGDTWETIEQKYTVMSIKNSYRLNGVNYKKVIYLKSYFKRSSDSMAYHMYAQGAGQIYSYLPSYFSQLFLNTELKLIK